MSETLKFGNGQWATKVGSTLAYNDENDNFKPLPFNFTRSTSATRVNKDGLIEVVTNNKPRIDFLNDSNGALLLEPARTNSLLQSNQFDTTWTTTNATVTSEQVGVGGSTDAWKIEKTAANGYIRHIGISVVNGSVSVFAKKGASNWLRLGTSSGNIETYFDLENGIIGNKGNLVDTSDIVDMGDGWYRCSFSYTGTVTGVYLYPADNNGDTSQTSGSVYLQYCQIEAGSYATSYIPTQGATTRAAETCNNAGNDQAINSTEGTMYVNLFDIKSQSFDSITLNDNSGTDNNQVRIWFFNNTITYQYNIGGSASAQISSSTINLTSETKICCTWKLNEFKLYINGIKIGEDVSGNVLSASVLKSLDFKRGSGAGSFYGNVKDVKIYNTSLTDLQLQQLTTL